MPISLTPDRGDVPPLGDPAFDALLARALRPEEAVASLRPVVESFAALYAAPVHSGPAAESRALTAFRTLAGLGHGTAGGRPGPRAAHRRAGRRSTRGWARSRLAGIRLAVATAAVAAVAAGGGALAAYVGDLPAPMQRLAHDVIGAPPAAVGGAPRPELGRPGTRLLSGNAAHGLCRAYEQALAHGRSGPSPVTFRRLAAAAGGAGQVPGYCARLVAPAHPANGHPAHPAARQTTHAGRIGHDRLGQGHARPSQAASNHGKHGR